MTRTLPIDLPNLGSAASGRRSAVALGEGSAHAKAILFGEHAVVYGAPAVAIPIHELEAEARVEGVASGIRIESELFSGDAAAAPTQLQPIITAVRSALKAVNKADSGVRVQVLSAIPHSRGLGSSAAVAAAVARAVANWAAQEFDAAQLYDVVQSAEQIAHGNPSGLDARAVTADTAMRFDFGAVSEVPLGATLHFVIADSGIAGSTAEAVGAVRKRREYDPQGMDALISRLAEVAEQGVTDLTLGNVSRIGEGMDHAHELLDRIGVSSPALNFLVAAARDAGALGAKLTGGGLGGCVLALAASAADAETLASTLRKAGAPRTWTATVPAL